ncbi:MAG: pyridoxal-phosphate dependent enzyme [Phycisphaeraceae bacterium]|nr:pyridoxal-phosphate dependent enzyme [Phycisphaeraceae bacterium]
MKDSSPAPTPAPRPALATSPAPRRVPLAATLDDVREAAERIRPFAHRTPVHTSRTLDALCGRELFFKCELFQRVGAFKFRGACNAVMKLSDAEAARGVVTHSSGNHAQALALAARLRGIPAFVVMPSNAPRVKRQAVEEYGAEVIPCEPTLEARERTAAEVVARTGGTLIPPYDHPSVIAGQGTMALELLEQAPELEAIVVPVGGGGMISGVAIAAKALKPSIRIIGAEPEAVGDAALGKRTGRLEPATNAPTMADGLKTALGELTFPVVQTLVDEIITVDEASIVRAMRLVWERMKLLIEPSAAVGVAAVLGAPPPERRIGIILCGGNVDLDALPW